MWNTKKMTLEKKIYSSSNISLECKDYLVSGETFSLLHNAEYNILYTSPVPENISKYYESEDYISHSKEKKGFITFLYNSVRNISLKKKEILISSFGLEKKVLDVGSGTGSFLSYCKTKGWKTFGVEPSKKARVIAKEAEIDLVKELNDIKETNFSIITLWHVLEHIPNLSETIQILKSKLSKNGRLIIAVPNFESYDAKTYKQFWAAYDVPRHIWHFSKKSISKIFERFNMDVEKIEPMKYDSFYVSLLSEKHKTGKNKFFKAFLNGFRSNYKAKKENNYSSLIYCIKNK